MKLSRIVFFFVLSVLVLFSACKKEELSEEIITEKPVTPTSESYNPLVFSLAPSTAATDGLDLGCFSVDFPFALDISGVEVAIASEADLETALQDLGEDDFVDFVYPLNITYPDGETEAVADGEALGEAFASCVPDSGWDINEGDFPAFLICELNSCYQIVYPINLVDSEGNTYVATTEEEFIDLLAEHYDLLFEFPIAMIDLDGETVTANNDEELFELLAACDEVTWPGNDTTYVGGFDGIFCYAFGYPLTVIDEDGNETIVNNEDEFFEALLNGDLVEFGFPMTLVDLEGNETIVNNEDELNAALEECTIVTEWGIDAMTFVFMSTAGQGECYDIVYPVNFAGLFSNDYITINNEEELLSFFDNTTNPYVLDTPTDVILADGSTVTIENEIQMFEIWDTCE